MLPGVMKQKYIRIKKENLGKLLKRFKIEDVDITDFSIYLAKRMKDVILEKLSSRIDNVYFSYEIVESYFLRLSNGLVNKMLDVISKTWTKQLDFCVVRPTHYVSEKGAYCTCLMGEDF